MKNAQFDVIFVGGGLANGLAAYRLNQFRPDLRLLVFEAGPSCGGNHTWSFHQGDLNVRQRAWVSPFVARSWAGYDVHFPQFSRTVFSGYYSIQSSQFHGVLKKQLGSSLQLNTKIAELYPEGVVLESGEKVLSHCVIDGRGWQQEDTIQVGYQKFFGLDVTLQNSHGLKRPVLMDGRIEQKDGYRFYYLLPWSEKRVLVEDTCYSDTPEINEIDYRNNVLSYIKGKGWQVASEVRQEKGALPIPLSGEIQRWRDHVPLSGMRAGLFHATTGYSFPQAVRFAEALADLGRYDGISVFKWAKAHSQEHWEKESFHRLLNRMLFKAADPDQRFKVLQKFYRFPDDMISRFYSGRMSSFDHLRVFSGRPPVPVSKAIRCLF